MTFLNQIFRSKKTDSTTNNSEEMQNNFMDELDDRRFENIFVNKDEPVREETRKSISPLDEFIERDHYRMGFNDGYNTHSTDAMRGKANIIKSEFRNLLSHKIEELRKLVLELEDHFINVEGMDERMEKKLQKRIDYTKEKCQDLESEKALSVVDEGMVMQCIHKYNDGYLAGTQQYIDENLLANTNGLFD